MGKPTQPLLDEHRTLLPHIELLKTAADVLGEADLDTTRRLADEAYAFLSEHLLPHAHAEDRALYPVVGRLMGAPEATATMSRDHAEVARLTKEVGEALRSLRSCGLDPEETKELRRALYGLHTLVKVHLAKEEEVYLPLLDERLTTEEAADVFQAMSRAAREVTPGEKRFA